MLAAITDGTAGVTDGRRQTELGFRAYFRWVAEDHDAFMLLYGSGTGRDEEFSRAVRRVTAAMVQAIAPLIAADIDDEHRLTLAHALVGLAEGASRRLVERGHDFDPDEVPARSATWPGPACAASTADPDERGGRDAEAQRRGEQLACEPNPNVRSGRSTRRAPARDRSTRT